MSDSLALLRAIEANPDEDTPRLAYADWLDENAGSGVKGKQAREWATYIRSQIAFARSTPADPQYWDSECWSWKNQRTSPLAAFTLLPKKCPGGRLSRGFPECLDTSARTFLANAKELAACPAPLVALELSQARPHIAAILKQSCLSRFRRLGLTRTQLTQADFRKLRNSRRLSHLISLRLWNSGLTPSEIEDFADDNTLTNLRELTLKESRDDGVGAASLARSPTLGNLEALTLDGATFPDEAGTAFANSPHMTRLKSLHLNHHLPHDAWLEQVVDGALPALASLRLGWGDCAGKGVAALLASPRFATLDLLEFRSAEMPPEAWAAVPANPGPPGLTLRYSPPSGNAVVALFRSAAIARCSTLELNPCESLRLEHLAVLGRSEHARHLRVLKADRPRGVLREENAAQTLKPFAESPHLAGLLVLDLTGHIFDDAAFDVLTQATFAGSLRSLTLDGEFTATSVRKLLNPAVFPKLKLLTMTVARTGYEELAGPIYERIHQLSIQPRWW